MQRFVPHPIEEHAGHPCWEWVGYKTPNGYGSIAANHPIRMVYAHRAMYEKFRGPIPEGLQIDHLCCNRWCVNPEHMEPVTCRENLLRGKTITAVCASKTHCPKGHAYDTENTVRELDGSRKCRECKNARLRLAYWKRLGYDQPPADSRQRRRRHGNPSKGL